MKTKTEFYFFRHGESSSNQKMFWCGQKDDAALSSQGRKQTLDLLEHLKQKNLSFDLIYSSPLQRALCSAGILAYGFSCQISVRKELIEADYGVAEMMTFADVKKNFPEVYDAWIKPHPQKYGLRFEKGESLQEVLERVFPLLDEISMSSAQRVLLVSHAGVLCSLMNVLGIENPRIANCEGFKVVRDEGGYWLDEIL